MNKPDPSPQNPVSASKSISLGSLAELETHLTIASKLKYLAHRPNGKYPRANQFVGQANQKPAEVITKQGRLMQKPAPSPQSPVSASSEEESCS